MSIFSDDSVIDVTKKLSLYFYETENKREQSLLDQAGKMLMEISVLVDYSSKGRKKDFGFFNQRMLEKMLCLNMKLVTLHETSKIWSIIGRK